MPIPPTSPLPRTLAREEVYQQIRTWIVEGALEAGETVRDSEMAAQLGVSRTPVREALRRLEDEGLIETARNRWTRVAPLNLSQARELYPLVAALESLALKLAWDALGDSAQAAMQEANAALGRALQARDLRGALGADEQFHGVWLSHAGNQELTALLSALKLKLQRIELAYFNLDAAEDSPKEHAALLAAIQTRNQAAALAALEANWQNTLARLAATHQLTGSGSA